MSSKYMEEVKHECVGQVFIIQEYPLRGKLYSPENAVKTKYLYVTGIEDWHYVTVVQCNRHVNSALTSGRFRLASIATLAKCKKLTEQERLEFIAEAGLAGINLTKY